MDVREKLVELLGRCAVEESITIAPVAENRLVDFLANHGVTVQEWISVDDRLPIEEAKAHEQEWPGEYPEFIVMIERGSLPTTLYYDLKENEWFRINTALERETYKVTHWMPIPEPPKGE